MGKVEEEEEATFSPLTFGNAPLLCADPIREDGGGRESELLQVAPRLLVSIATKRFSSPCARPHFSTSRTF